MARRLNHSVMIVEDDDDIREMLKIILENQGYGVMTAVDGVNACEHITAGYRPSLILLDLRMPRMDGEEFIVQLRSGPAADIPVVVMSGNKIKEEDLQRMKSDGMLIKPIELDDILSVVQKFTGAPEANRLAS